LLENIFLPANADVDVINVGNISVNVGAWVIMLVVVPETYDDLTSTFSLPSKEERHVHMDDASLSFNDKGNAIANYLMNTKDFAPDNVWVDDDSRISDVDLHLPPSPSQSGEQLWKHFHSLKTKFALVDEVF
jgi:hypothetical protein